MITKAKNFRPISLTLAVRGLNILLESAFSNSVRKWSGLTPMRVTMRMPTKKQYNLVTNDELDTRVPLHPEEAFTHGIKFSAKVSSSAYFFLQGNRMGRENGEEEQNIDKALGYIGG